MRITALLIYVFVLLSFSNVKKLPSSDVPGSSDHPLLGRPEGSVIAGFSKKDFDSIRMPLEIDYRRGKVVKHREFEGKIYRIYYVMPGKISPLAVQKAYENKLKQKGFKTVYKCYPCSRFSAIMVTELAEKGIEQNWGVLPPRKLGFILMEGEYEGKRTYVGVYSYPLYKLTHARVRVVEAEKLKLKLEVVTAEEIGKSIKEKGSVSIYGIYFDHDSYEIKPESKRALEEIARFLRSNPNIKLFVVGHTDNTGSYEYNMNLSRKRAEAVVNKLVNDYKIPKERLKPIGVGPVAPVAPNDSEEGRAKNRRVELVPM